MWILYAFISAVFAALVAIFGKLGLKSVDATLATTIRSIIMAVFLFAVSFSIGKWSGFSLGSLAGKDWLLVALSGIAGAISWLFYFLAIKYGVVTSVVAIDRLSIIFVIVLAGIFLAEPVGWRAILGAVLMAAGAILISLK